MSGTVSQQITDLTNTLVADNQSLTASLTQIGTDITALQAQVAQLQANQPIDPTVLTNLQNAVNDLSTTVTNAQNEATSATPAPAPTPTPTPAPVQTP